jgi:hypothetical protein
VSIITVGIVIVTSIAAAVYVSWPLLVGSADPEAGDDESELGATLDQLLVQKESTYSALKELEFDHAMGNLSREDYQELIGRYEDRAVALLKTIDHVAQEESAGREDPVEREVASLRRRGRGGGAPASGEPEEEIEEVVAGMRQSRRHRPPQRLADDIEEEVVALRRGRREAAGPGDGAGTEVADAPATCPSCRAHLRSEAAAFCSRCGASLRTSCPNCRAQVDRDDIFCSGCGTALRRGDAEPVAQTRGGVDA